MILRIALLLLGCSVVVAAETPSIVWDVEYLAGDYQNPMVYSDEIVLRDHRDNIVKRCTSKQIETMHGVMQQIEAVSELDVSFYVIEGNEPNAYAGVQDDAASVFVNFGMMDLIQADADQWAALLGHEVAHIKLEHGDKNSKRNIPITILKSTVGLVSKNPLAQQAGQYLATGIDSKFNRDQERQSDYLGLIWSIEAGYDPYAAAALHEEMSRQALRFNIPFISSHPSDRERIDNLTEMAKRLDKHQ